MDKRPLVVGNWKMELSHRTALNLLTSLGGLCRQETVRASVVVCPSYPALSEAAAILVDEKLGDLIELGAQAVHWEEKGAWTGQVSVLQIAPLVKWCLVGHSEQRDMLGETDEQAAAKATLLLKHGISPIICIGESAAERAGEQTVDKITTQVEIIIGSLQRTSLSKVVIAYEPIWAIGTGEMPAAQEVAEIALLIRKIIAGRFDHEAAEKVRILYGGSVTADTVQQYASEPGVDGVLVGGASTNALGFTKIIQIVQGK